MLPAGHGDQMFYSTLSTLDKESTLSSDEDGDIYCHRMQPAGNTGDPTCSPNQRETSDPLTDTDTLCKDRNKSNQVLKTFPTKW